MIRTQGIPVNSIIEVRDGKGFLIRRYRRTASVYRLEEHGQCKKRLILHFTRARADAPIDLEGLQIPSTITS